jgi:hypothetical protein
MSAFIQNLRRDLRVCSTLRSPWNSATEGLRCLSPVNETESRLGTAEAILGEVGGLLATESPLLKVLTKRGKVPDKSGEEPGVVFGDSLYLGAVTKRGRIFAERSGDEPGLQAGLLGDKLDFRNRFSVKRGDSGMVLRFYNEKRNGFVQNPVLKTNKESVKD